MLLSKDHGENFSSKILGAHRLATCPMSSMDLASGTDGSILAAWEKDGQIYETAVTTASLEFGAPELTGGDGAGRKHPVIVLNAAGNSQLIAWTEGTGWEKGGALAWEVTDLKTGAKKTGRAPGVPVWGRVTAVAEREGTFTVIY
jgi:hypothetical protein